MRGIRREFPVSVVSGFGRFGFRSLQRPLYEGPLALSPSHLEMFTLSRILCQGDEDALLLIMSVCTDARCTIFNNAVCTLHCF
jgi:hypothetical protein